MLLNHLSYHHRIGNKQSHLSRNVEVCVLTHTASRMFIMQVLASQLHFVANRNVELTVPPLCWPVNCTKIGRHVGLLSGTSVNVIVEWSLGDKG